MLICVWVETVGLTVTGWIRFSFSQAARSGLRCVPTTCDQMRNRVHKGFTWEDSMRRETVYRAVMASKGVQ